MSSLPEPVNEKDHPVCDYPMACDICMTRCYKLPHDIHHFNAPDGMVPCECGKYKNINEASEKAKEKT